MSATGWQGCNLLVDFLLQHQVFGCQVELRQRNGNQVRGVLSSFCPDSENVFLTLTDVTINDDHLAEWTVFGVDVAQWRVLDLPQPATVQPKPAIPVEASNIASNLYIDKSVFHNPANRGELTFNYDEVSGHNDAPFIGVDLELLKLKATNQIELIKYSSISSQSELQDYYHRCSLVVRHLHSEDLIGMALLPNNSENEATLRQINKLNSQTFLQSLNLDVVYLCFSVSTANYAFRLINDNSVSSEINHHLMNILQPLIESDRIRKAVYRCALLSGILWHQYRVTLCNICDLQLVDLQVQQMNNSIGLQRQRNIVAHSLEQLISYYLKIDTTEFEAISSWISFTNRVQNMIRFNLIFLRELANQMCYETIHFVHVFSDRTLASLREAATEMEQLTLADIDASLHYKLLLSQPLLQGEKLSNPTTVDVMKYFPVKYYDPVEFLGKQE